MQIKKFLLATLALCALAFPVVGMPVLAFAQEAATQITVPTDTIVNVGDLVNPWLQLILSAAGIIIPAAALWAAAELRRRTGISVETSHREAFQTALTNATGLLLAHLGQRAQGITFDARHPAVKEAILYVNKASPDALKYFGLGPDQIAEKIAAKIGVMTAAPPPEVVNVSIDPSTGSGG